jgi:hypothetical protein
MVIGPACAPLPSSLPPTGLIILPVTGMALAALGGYPGWRRNLALGLPVLLLSMHMNTVGPFMLQGNPDALRLGLPGLVVWLAILALVWRQWHPLFGDGEPGHVLERIARWTGTAEGFEPTIARMRNRYRGHMAFGDLANARRAIWDGYAEFLRLTPGHMRQSAIILTLLQLWWWWRRTDD